MKTNLYFWGTTEKEYLDVFKAFYTKYPTLVYSSTGVSSLGEIVSYVKTYFEAFSRYDLLNAFEVYGDNPVLGHIHNLESYFHLEGDQPINVWDEEGQVFEVVSLKQLLETLKKEV